LVHHHQILRIARLVPNAPPRTARTNVSLTFLSGNVSRALTSFPFTNVKHQDAAKLHFFQIRRESFVKLVFFALSVKRGIDKLVIQSA
jgi:hypothetical protein